MITLSEKWLKVLNGLVKIVTVSSILITISTLVELGLHGITWGAVKFLIPSVYVDIRGYLILKEDFA